MVASWSGIEVAPFGGEIEPLSPDHAPEAARVEQGPRHLAGAASGSRPSSRGRLDQQLARPPAPAAIRPGSRSARRRRRAWWAGPGAGRRRPCRGDRRAPASRCARPRPPPRRPRWPPRCRRRPDRRRGPARGGPACRWCPARRPGRRRGDRAVSREIRSGAGLETGVGESAGAGQQVRGAAPLRHRDRRA